MGHREAVAVLVEHRDVRGVLGDGARIEARHGGFHAALDLFGHLFRVGLGGQVLDRHLDELGVADMGVLVDGGALHGLAHDAQIFGRVVLERAQVEFLQDVQHLEQHDAAAGRLVGRDLVAAIVAP